MTWPLASVLIAAFLMFTAGLIFLSIRRDSISRFLRTADAAHAIATDAKMIATDAKAQADRAMQTATKLANQGVLR